ncbi:hypothetical protein PVAND_007909 [Polypedilum vanderplanki]|uniref:Peptidoglycan-recognition protein n=1 Tax=Polypedilum vanderplanki TaxID=319348 RepID=A0A9J6C822_POLVA|nr:hypothetical protein PVAND_007909 [Polypedilum vanderplanki]
MTKDVVLLAAFALLLSLIQFGIFCPRIITRAQWGGSDPLVKMKPLILPAFYFIIHQSFGPTCFNQTSCVIQMRNIQNFHIHSHKLPDIGYNFCIGQDGNVYEGRGWEVQGADVSGFSSHSLSICFIGSFEMSIPNFITFLAAQELILCGINKGFVSSSYSLIAHRQISALNSQCPGNALLNELKRNTRFKNNPQTIR